MHGRKLLLLTSFVVFSSLAAWSQTAQMVDRLRDPLSVRPMDRVALQVDDTRRVALRGSVHPLANPVNLVGDVLPGQAMAKIVLVLRPDLFQDAALQELIPRPAGPGIAVLPSMAHAAGFWRALWGLTE